MTTVDKPESKGEDSGEDATLRAKLAKALAGTIGRYADVSDIRAWNEMDERDFDQSAFEKGLREFAPTEHGRTRELLTRSSKLQPQLGHRQALISGYPHLQEAFVIAHGKLKDDRAALRLLNQFAFFLAHPPGMSHIRPGWLSVIVPKLITVDDDDDADESFSDE